MTTNRYDDELLSTIIDGEASPETVAAVEGDPMASKRLAAMRSAVDVVATPVPEATPERRSASIAAAMAAATPASPEVSSLSAKRHEREEKKKGLPTGWLVAAAAALFLVILGTPLIFDGGADSADVAADAVELVAEFESSDGPADDTAGASANSLADSEDGDDEAMEDEEEVEEEAMEDVEEEAMEDEESDDAATATAEASSAPEAVDFEITVVTTVEEIEELVAASDITPELAGDDVIAIESFQARSTSELDEVLATDVNPQCLNPGEETTGATPYSLIVLDPFAGAPQLVLVEFSDDGTSRLLDAETCEVIR